MQYSNTTTKAGIIQFCEDLINIGDTGISGDTTLLRKFTAWVNESNREVLTWIHEAYGGWIYDDSNQTDLPQATTDLTESQATYSLPTDLLIIQRVEIKDSAGDWVKLEPMALQQIDEAIDEFHEDDGQPMYYRLVGQTIELFPASNYDSTSGLKIYYERSSVDFQYDDTTDTPGFASHLHEALPCGAAIRYLKARLPKDDRLPIYIADWQNWERKIKSYYQDRFQDYQPIILRGEKINYE